MTKISVEKAVEIVKAQAYDDSQFYQFVEVNGERLPAKRFYAALFGIRYQDVNTRMAENALKNDGYSIISTRPAFTLPTIWKVSHGPDFINGSDKDWLLKKHYITVHEDTGRGGANNFIENVQIGDIVSLGYGNKVAKLVKIISDVIDDDTSPFESDWKLRKYVDIVSLPVALPYEGINKGWSPRNRSTCAPIPTNELALFEEQILNKYYNLSLEELKYLYSQFDDYDEYASEMNGDNNMNAVSLNQILYGPPGTGKTYHTIEAAVKAAAPEFQWTKRDDLKEKYDLLVSEKRIRFVTFHQSYGYEEFVEGISAKTDNGQVSYYEKDGIFKEICQDATLKETDDLEHFELALNSLMHEADGENIELTTSRGNSFTFTYHGNSTFRIFPLESKHEDLGKGYPASIKHIRSLYTTGDESDIYNRSYVRAILNYLKEKYNVKDYDETKATAKAKNYVLIIDEINRGNISKIFGELITLIEPSKRAGSLEKIEVTLPYTGHKFSVPDNLYIIGTMNTADRSLALMDTALRRRFEFIEMMPDSGKFKPGNLIDSGDGKSIDLARLLDTLNARIEALYDREHTLGHAFFFPAYNAVKEGDHALALQELQSAFKRKVIPLLQEYFYDDWSKIRLVLGDNQKLDKQGSAVGELQFIHKKNFEYDKLFGSSDESDNFASDEYRYELADDKHEVWGNGLAYIAIYDPTVAKGDKKQLSEAQVQNEGA